MSSFKKKDYSLITRHRYRMMKIMVGFFVVLSLLSLLVLLWIGQDQLTPFSKTVSFQVRIKNAKNIKQGMPVLISGIAVGEVSLLDLEPDGNIRMLIKIKKKFHSMVTTGAHLKLNSSLVGASKLSIITGAKGAHQLEENSFLKFPAGTDTDELMSSLPSLIKKVEKILDNTQSLTDLLSNQDGSLLSSVDNLNTITSSLKDFIDRETRDTGRASRVLDLFNQNLKQLEYLIIETNGTIKSLKSPLAKLTPIMTNFEKGSKNSVVFTSELLDFLARINKNVETLEKILADISQISARFNKVSPEVSDMINRTRVVTEQANQILDAAKRSPLLKSSFPDIKIKPVESNPRIEWPLENHEE